MKSCEKRSIKEIYKKNNENNGQERSKRLLRTVILCSIIRLRSKIVKVKTAEGTLIMRISDMIALFIDDILSETGGTAELQRAELANRFNCVPSQINYVIATRFSPEHGYIVESRRGGGGFIRITRVEMEPELLIMHTVNTIGTSITLGGAAALIANLTQSGVLTVPETRLINAAIGNNALRPLQPEGRDVLRASILKQMLVNKL